MDNIDTTIVREILYDPVDPIHAARGIRRPWDVARSLGVHGTTVKRRIAEMRERGFFPDAHLVPAPELLGLRSSHHFITFPDAAAKRRGMERLREQDEVWEAYGFVGNDVMVLMATAEDKDPFTAAQRVGDAVGASNVRFHHTTRRQVPVERVSALDLRIMAAFARDALRSVSDAAAEVGVGTKTVTNRMRALDAIRAFRVHSIVDFSRVETGMPALLDITLTPGAGHGTHAELTNRFPIALCRTPLEAESAYVVIHAASAVDLEAALRRAESVEGVEQVQVYLLHEAFDRPSVWANLLLQRAEQLARARGLYAPSWLAKPVQQPGNG